MFARNLKYLRTKHHMEQLELADKLGRKSSSSISEWEKGKYTPKLKVLNEIAKIFNVDIDDLMNTNLSLQDKKNHSTQILSLDKAIAKKINNIKNKKELSSEYLAVKLDLSIYKVDLYLQGSLPFTVSLVFKFAQALGVTFDEIFPHTRSNSFDEIPAILDIDEKKNIVITSKGETYSIEKKEIQQIKDFLEFIKRE